MRILHVLVRPGAVCSVGLLLRLSVIAMLLLLGFFKNPETWENGTLATHILNGEGFSASWGQPLEPTSFQAPVYPYLLAASWRLFGQGAPAYVFLAVLQAVAVSVMVFPIHALTRRWFGAVPAILAAWVCVLAPLYLWFPVRIHHTALVIAVHPWLVLGWLTLTDATNDPVAELEVARRRRPWLRAVGVGVLTGLAGLTQPVLLPLYGLLSALLLVQHLAKGRVQDAAVLLAAGLVTLLVLTPWTVRNYQVHGRLVPVKDSFGKEFWMGNNPYATGTGFAEGGETEITMAHPPKAFALRGSVSEIQLMDALEAEAWDYIRADKIAFVERTAQKILWFWTNPPERVARNYGRATLLVHCTHLAYWMAFVALCALAAGTRPMPRDYLVVLGLCAGIYSVAYGLIHVGQPRYRGEIESIFLPGVGAGAAWIVARFLPRTYAALVRATAAPEAQRP